MKKKRVYLPALIVGIWSLFSLTACSADEEALFVESTETFFYEDDTEEQSSITSQEGTEAYAGSEDSYPQTVVFKEDKRLAVHVCGAVNVPGVYELEEGSRVMDAVLAAGGFSQEADEEYANLATVLADGDKVRIPTKDEVTHMSSMEGQKIDDSVISSANPDNIREKEQDKVNINTADKEQLCTLPGIGQTRAESIIAYREAKGSFLQIEDIMQVSGIKESSFQKIKDRITVK